MQKWKWQKLSQKLSSGEAKPDTLMSVDGAIVFAEINNNVHYIVTGYDPNISFISLNYHLFNNSVVKYTTDSLSAYVHQALAFKVAAEEKYGLPIKAIVENINSGMYSKDELKELTESSLTALIDGRFSGRISPDKDVMLSYEDFEAEDAQKMLTDGVIRSDTEIYIDAVGYIGTIDGKINKRNVSAKQKHICYNTYLQGRVLFGIDIFKTDIKRQRLASKNKPLFDWANTFV